MSDRAGFTLLELITAIVVSALVALMAYGAVSAGLRSHERVAELGWKVQGEAVLRSVLSDAVRHPVDEGGAAMNDTLFAVEDALAAGGLAADRLRFVSRGVVPPLGASDAWVVTVSPEARGVRLVATPVSGAGATLDVSLPEARGLSVRVRDRTGDAGWIGEWHLTGRVPAAVEVVLLSAAGRPLGPPLVVATALEPAP